MLIMGCILVRVCLEGMHMDTNGSIGVSDKNDPLAYVWSDGDYVIHDDLDGMEPHIAKSKSEDYMVVYGETVLTDVKHQFNYEEEFEEFVRELYGFIKWY